MKIYKITNKINNKIYIGQTINCIQQRFRQHLANKDNTRLANSIRKYGKDNFTIEEIDSAETLEELNEKEIYWISYFNTMEHSVGFNMQFGGNNKTHSEESKRKIGRANKGRRVYFTAETKEKLSKARKGKKFSEEHKKNLSESLKGKKRTHVKKKIPITSKLTPELVLKLRELYETGNYTVKQLYIEFGISDRTVRDVVSRKTWKEV